MGVANCRSVNKGSKFFVCNLSANSASGLSKMSHFILHIAERNLSLSRKKFEFNVASHRGVDYLPIIIRYA